MHKNGAKMFWRQKAPWHALYKRSCRLQYCDFTRWVSATNNNSTFYFIENLPTRIWIRSFMFYLYCITLFEWLKDPLRTFEYESNVLQLSIYSF